MLGMVLVNRCLDQVGGRDVASGHGWERLGGGLCLGCVIDASIHLRHSSFQHHRNESRTPDAASDFCPDSTTDISLECYNRQIWFH